MRSGLDQVGAVRLRRLAIAESTGQFTRDDGNGLRADYIKQWLWYANHLLRQVFPRLLIWTSRGTKMADISSEEQP